jgi:hypothetical protein
MVDYIEQRLFDMVLISGVTTEEWLREFTTNLVAYGSSLLVMRRSLEKSRGERVRLHGKKLDPIAAVFPLDPTSVKVKLNDHGHPVRWMQRVSDAIGSKHTATFSNNDIILATIDKKSGFVFGTPYILPTLDDVRSLRRIEEIVEIIAQKHAFPITHWRVGDKEFPPEIYDDGTTEVETVAAEIRNMPTEGGVVTTYRVEGDVMGMDGQAIDLNPYLTYFERRVMGGLRLSPEDLGRSGESNKGSAVTTSETLQEASKDFQSVIVNTITYQLFLPLLLEGGFNVTRDNLVRLEFSLINREEERARQSHANDIYLAGGITRTEFRKDFLGKKELSEEDCTDCVPEQKHKFDVELARIGAAAKAANAASNTNKSATKKSANTTRPSNQSGRKSTKTRVKANDFHKEFYSDVVVRLFSDTRGLLRNFMEEHGHGVNQENDDPFDVSTKDDQLRIILESFVTYATAESRNLLRPIITDGIQRAMLDMAIEGEYKIPKRTEDRFFKNTIEKEFKKVSNNLYNQINSDDCISGVTLNGRTPFIALSAIADMIEDELKSICGKHIDIAHRFAYSRAAKAHGKSTIYLTPEEENTCESCVDGGTREISLMIKDIPYRMLLDTHEDCEFSMSLSE